MVYKFQLHYTTGPSSLLKLGVEGTFIWGCACTSFMCVVLSAPQWIVIRCETDGGPVMPGCVACTGLFELIVGVLTTCHTQYTWDSIFLFNRTTLQVFVTYLTVALYVHPLWFYKQLSLDNCNWPTFMKCKHTKRLLTAVRRHHRKVCSKRRNP